MRDPHLVPFFVTLRRYYASEPLLSGTISQPLLTGGSFCSYKQRAERRLIVLRCVTSKNPAHFYPRYIPLVLTPCFNFTHIPRIRQSPLLVGSIIPLMFVQVTSEANGKVTTSECNILLHINIASYIVTFDQ